MKFVITWIILTMLWLAYITVSIAFELKQTVFVIIGGCFLAAQLIIVIAGILSIGNKNVDI